MYLHNVGRSVPAQI